VFSRRRPAPPPLPRCPAAPAAPLPRCPAAPLPRCPAAPLPRCPAAAAAASSFKNLMPVSSSFLSLLFSCCLQLDKRKIPDSLRAPALALCPAAAKAKAAYNDCNLGRIYNSLTGQLVDGIVARLSSTSFQQFLNLMGDLFQCAAGEHFKSLAVFLVFSKELETAETELKAEYERCKDSKRPVTAPETGSTAAAANDNNNNNNNNNNNEDDEVEDEDYVFDLNDATATDPDDPPLPRRMVKFKSNVARQFAKISTRCFRLYVNVATEVRELLDGALAAATGDDAFARFESFREIVSLSPRSCRTKVDEDKVVEEDERKGEGVAAAFTGVSAPAGASVEPATQEPPAAAADVHCCLLRLVELLQTRLRAVKGDNLGVSPPLMSQPQPWHLPNAWLDGSPTLRAYLFDRNAEKDVGMDSMVAKCLARVSPDAYKDMVTHFTSLGAAFCVENTTKGASLAFNCSGAYASIIRCNQSRTTATRCLKSGKIKTFQQLLLDPDALRTASKAAAAKANRRIEARNRTSDSSCSPHAAKRVKADTKADYRYRNPAHACGPVHEDWIARLGDMSFEPQRQVAPTNFDACISADGNGKTITYALSVSVSVCLCVSVCVCVCVCLCVSVSGSVRVCVSVCV
jgi:hypothetical protein